MPEMKRMKKRTKARGTTKMKAKIRRESKQPRNRRTRRREGPKPEA
jgi:hypothetical protein